MCERERGSLWRELLHDAMGYLREHGQEVEGNEIKVDVSLPGGPHFIVVGLPPPEVPRPVAADGWKILGRKEARVVTWLRGRGWQKTADLAREVQQANTSEFRVLLRNLRDRGIVELSKRYGIRLVEGINPGQAHSG